MSRRDALVLESEHAAATWASPRALRVVLVLALDRACVGSCLGIDPADTGQLWPSTLYAWAAEAAARSPRVWLRCARAIDDALGPWLVPLRGASTARVAELLGGRESAALLGPEIAAALWTLVRRRERGLAPITERLAMEAEILVARASVAPGDRPAAAAH